MGLLQRFIRAHERIHCNGRAIITRREILGVRQRVAPILIGSTAWREWIGQHDLLEYRDKAGCHAMLRKERRGKRFYWYAYTYGVGRGEYSRVYVGKLEQLTANRLRGLVYQLTARAKEQKSMTAAEQARRARRARAARQRRYRARHAGAARRAGPGVQSSQIERFG